MRGRRKESVEGKKLYAGNKEAGTRLGGWVVVGSIEQVIGDMTYLQYFEVKGMVLIPPLANVMRSIWRLKLVASYKDSHALE
jgi:hypothetical protein